MKLEAPTDHRNPSYGNTRMRKRLATLSLAAVSALLLVVTTGDSSEAGRKIRSEAYEKQDAIDYCESKLKCSEKDPPEVATCRGNPRRWICECKPSNSAKRRRRRPRLQFEFDFGLGRGHDHDYEPYYE